MEKTIYLKITFDDEGGYKGHGEDAAEIMCFLLEREIEMSLESDGVIKKGWGVEIVEQNTL